jgi:mono/diheme cytochrome c family protein
MFESQPGEKKQMMGNLPVTVSPAKPALTPAPDPFPPRPTPTLVVQNGKIVQQWQAPAEAVSMTNPVKDRPDAVKIGREYYMQKCVDCHGKEGKGNGYMSKMVAKPPTNLASQMVQANTDGELFWKVTNGKSPMPAHRVRFDDEQRWYIVTYLRTFKP